MRVTRIALSLLVGLASTSSSALTIAPAVVIPCLPVTLA